jgi:N-acetylglucosaminyldiphosphoundecaprenol N-acetyl-beta-D-mannosaminyltransferase
MVEQRERCWVGPIDFEVTTIDEAVQRSIDDAVSGRGGELHFANAWSIALATEDNNLGQAFRGGLNYPDGKPVVWAMRLFRRGHHNVRPHRVHGPTFFGKAVALGISQEIKHYFLGSTPETLEKLQHNLRSRYPTICIVGVSSPPYKDHTAEDYDEELEKIRACQPDIVWIGLGTPKQDLAAAYMAPRYPAVFACVGGVFDFAAGNFRDAPHWMQEAGLAWLHRFAQEPRRLWRRYTYGNAKFIQTIAKQALSSKSQ